MKDKVLTKGFDYDDQLIHGDKIENRKCEDYCCGYSFELQYPSYRGTFLSCIESIQVTVDGAVVPPENIRLQLNGKEFLLSELKNMTREYWYILDMAKLFVREKGGLGEGPHSVQVLMKHRIPYTGYFGSYMILTSVCERTLEAV